MIIIAAIVTIFLAYANGANDNFKGVATLYGSDSTSFKVALTWATLCTALGSLAALILANGLIATFSGKGLVGTDVLANPAFLICVGAAAATTVMLATQLGFPISTTHALTGALIGTGLTASPTGVNISKVGSTFFAPLIISPLMAIALTGMVYFILHWLKKRVAYDQKSCLCVQSHEQVLASAATMTIAHVPAFPRIVWGKLQSCLPSSESGSFVITPAKTLDSLHFLSAGIVSFARGLNDTPKLAAILLVAKTIIPNHAIVIVAIAMAVGGILNSKKVAETVSHGVTKMNADQGLVANIVTALIVVFASRFGFPVSTTHVSCGSLFGIGAATKQAQWRTISIILLAWVTTLPIAAGIGAASFFVYSSMSGG